MLEGRGARRRLVLQGANMRIGVIGCGSHATTSLYPLFGAAGLDLVAVCARHKENAENAAARFGAEHAYGDARAMLEAGGIDGVVVSVKAPDYAPLVSLVLEAGLPVFTEKPGAGSSAEAHDLSRLAEERGLPVVVGYMKRFAPAYRRAREVITSKAFGQPTLGAFTFAMGGGAGWNLRNYIIDNPVHLLDMARFLIGDLKEMDLQITTGFAGHALAVAASTEPGAVATFNFCTTASWLQRNELAEVYGAGHCVTVENVDTCIHRPADGPAQVWRPTYTVPMPRNTTPITMGFLGELEHFREVATEGAVSLSDMASAARTLALAERLVDLAAV